MAAGEEYCGRVQTCRFRIPHDTHGFTMSDRDRHMVGSADNFFLLPELHDEIFDF